MGRSQRTDGRSAMAGFAGRNLPELSELFSLIMHFWLESLLAVVERKKPHQNSDDWF